MNLFGPLLKKAASEVASLCPWWLLCLHGQGRPLKAKRFSPRAAKSKVPFRYPLTDAFVWIPEQK